MYLDTNDAKVSVLYVLKWICSFTLALWVKVPLPIQTLAILMVIDYVSGTFAAQNENSWSPEEGRRGLRRKALSALLVMACSYASDVTGLGINIGRILATAMCVNELGSIFLNCSRAGVEIPQIALDFFINVRHVFGQNATAERIRKAMTKKKGE